MLKYSAMVWLTILFGHLLVGTVVRSECCHASGSAHTFLNLMDPLLAAFVSGSSLVCFDCSLGTPYCGREACNVFGCNCEGGCRTGRCDPDYREPAVDSTVKPVASTAAVLFDIDGVPIDILATWSDFENRHILPGLLGTHPGHFSWHQLMVSRSLNTAHRKWNTFIRSAPATVLLSFQGTPIQVAYPNIYESASAFEIDVLDRDPHTKLWRHSHNFSNRWVRAALNATNYPIHFDSVVSTPSG